jgi:spore germination cell wall hydrolase CwlJ-like protein
MLDAPATPAPEKDEFVDQVAQSRKSARPVLIGATGAAAAILFFGTNPQILPNIASLFERYSDKGPKGMSEKEMQREEIAQLISETDVDVAEVAAEGEDAISQNALLPKSGLPVEAARPFQLPHLTSAQAMTAERCLTQAIYYEAATESDAGKAAVAQVIINRMRHPAYPNSICSVIYQGSERPGCQFSFACDGSLARKPMPALWRRSNEIAKAALAGHVYKPVGMATHYHANYVLPYWAPKLAKIDQVGAHIFYRWPGGWGRPAAFRDAYVGKESIPAFETLFNINAVQDLEITDAEMAVPVQRDPTDHRSDNDVGGRVDVTKGWTPSIPDPTKGQSRYSALTGEQNAQADLTSKSE